MNTLSDSISTPAPWAPHVCRETDGPATAAEKVLFTSGKIAYTEGLVPQPRTMLPGYDSGVLCLLIGLFLLLSYNFRHYSTFLKNFPTDLLSIRRREGTFEVRTFSETGVLMSIVLVACLSEGIIINAAMTGLGLSAAVPGVFFVIGSLTLVAALYYLWQLGAYWTVGYVFTDKVSARLWMKGFNASQALTAFLLVVPALVVLFNPAATSIVVPLAVFFYILARSLFICKGFRLFYDNFSSLIYFILYLCTLEIVPLVAMYRTAVYINNLLLQTPNI
ncbi:MAG: DUF4271 domain-containing protein [Muribaculaceae bacterium]|nr:DUF4271 domain-containing protein [Muribaculaceae bacterium]